jgi:hypothetical protein
MFDPDKRIVRRAYSNEFVEFYLNRRAIAVLEFWITKTIKNVTIVVPVLITNCHVSE